MTDNKQEKSVDTQSTSAAIEQLFNEREIVVSKLTRFVEFVKIVTEDTLVELETRLEHVVDIFKQFDTIQGHIETIDSSQLTLTDREMFENSYYKSVATARGKIVEFHTNINQRTMHSVNNIILVQSTSMQNNFSRVSLPPIDLPNFDGDYKKWSFFFKRFSDLVDQNKQLSNIEKLYYLQGRLQGEAAGIIQDIELTEDNYSLAFKLLTDRYGNKNVMIDKHIDDLFDLPIVNNESPIHLRKLIDSFKQHVRSLKSLGEPTDTWDRPLIQLIKMKLDKNTRDRWQEKVHNEVNKSPPTLSQFLDFLVCRCEYLESLNKDKALHYTKHNQAKPTLNSKNSHSFSSTIKTISCFHCNQDHAIYNCKTFLALSLSEKYKQIKKIGLCPNCLRKGHLKFQCTSRGCRICQAKHNSILHPDIPLGTQSQLSSITQNNLNNTDSTASDIQQKSEHSQIVATNSTLTSIFTHSTENSLVLLSTAILYIKDVYGNFHSARALLDAGSQSNYIKNSFLQKLNLPTTDVNISVSGVGHNSIMVFKRVTSTIKSMHSNFQIDLPFLVLPRITDTIPNSEFSLSHIHIPKGISSADPSVNKPGDIDILLGASHFYDLLDSNRIFLGNAQASENSLRIVIKLTKFWELEESPPKKHLSLEEHFCETLFKETTTRDSQGRFIVKFPITKLIDQLGNSKPIALKRLDSIEKRFQHDHEYKELYVKFINEYLTLNHMSLVTSNVDDEPTFYLPHHGVKRESSSTTKLRVVYDGSAVTDTGISLNQCLGVGPQIQDDLFNIIIRFRTHSYILTADIEKMYRMVVVHPDHRKFQRMFWREDKDQPIQVFEMSRLAYGLSCAPYLATRCLQELAIQHMAQYPKSCNIILRDFFVDDLITGADSIQEALQLKHEISLILYSGGFALRKWSSNHNDIISNQSSKCQTFYEKTELKTLGLIWNPDDDILQYSVNFKPFKNVHVTKRQILSTISKIFDPLGLVGPTTIKAKILMQRIWQCQSSWDDPVPSHLLEIWKNFIDQIHSINNLKIPRHVLCTFHDRVEIHGFCDSLELAYGCCIYLRSFHSSECTVRLLCAKSRVAPLKKTTLPRLELCGAVTLARLLKVIQTALSKRIDQVFLYTDSQIVLAWISTQPCYLQTFVANRVAEITGITSISDWYHVKSNNNPADIISRGINPEQLMSCDLWWNGPQLLKNTNTQSLSSNINPILTGVQIPDMKISSTLLISQTAPEFEIFSKFSSFSKLLRVTAYILSFKNNCLKAKTVKQTESLSREELNVALSSLIKCVQAREFALELSALSKNQLLPKSSKLLNLHPFLDNDNVLRVGGRIQQSSVKFDQKHPIILPQKHLFTELLIMKEHLTNLHASTQLLLCIIRLRFWPLSGKNAVKRILRKCVRCFRTKPSCLSQLMGNLPANRFSTFRPFFKIAVDYPGPFLIKNSFLRNTKLIKSYVCVFVCLSTKATHLELVIDLSTGSFLNALKRFISRRGKPSDIHSDNGTNFVGCNNELRELNNFLSSKQNSTEIQNFLLTDNIKWHFNPAKSPHMGGLWEATVKSVKYHLRRVIFNDTLTFDDMYTLLVQVEACLNSRPLTQLSNDPADFSPLTPAHFLIGDSLAALPEVSVLEIPQTRLNRYKRLQQIQQHFWNRWSREYLTQLQIRSKWQHLQPTTLKIGALVILKEDNMPPSRWCMGRIVELFPGKDNVTRVVSVKVPSGAIYKRSIAKVCLIPIDYE